MTLHITTSTPDETLALGRRFAAVLTAGDIILLSGHLGVGKTVFVSGVAEGLGIAERITSPTFVIARIYRDGFLPMVHADVYRLGTLAEFEDLEIGDEAIGGVTLIEWGDAIADSIGPDRLTVRIDVDGDARVFSFEPSGTWSNRSLEMLT
jgi:tRNA threonylcarbamoyladenosine biosynthesis protein TsaE